MIGWVARDRNGRLALYYLPPLRRLSWWLGESGEMYNLDEDLFPKLAWEDEPVKVEIVLKEVAE